MANARACGGGLIVFALLVAGLSAAAQAPPQLSPETIATIEAAVAARMAEWKIPGLSLAIVTDNELRYANGFGLADLENSVPATPTTVFRIASLAKAMTATAVLQLAERGQLDLDAPIQTYCPAFPEKPWPLTARQLLAHLGGIRHYKDDAEARGTDHYFTLAEALTVFQDDPLLHEPGTKFSYTTFGYVVLGCAIEGASGMDYARYMWEHIFHPAGMERTEPDDAFKVIPSRARGYVRMTEENARYWPERFRRFLPVGETYNAQLHDTSIKIPGGGFVSTASDLVRFALAFQSGVLVNPETRELMWTRQKTVAGEEITWGLGWILPRAMAGEKAVRISGGQPGTSSALVLLPAKGFAVAAMANLEGIDLYPLVVDLGRMWGHFPGTLEE